MSAVMDYINEGAAPAERMIRDVVACELAYINTDHPAFVGGNRAIASVLERRCSASQGGGEEEEEELEAATSQPVHHTRSGGGHQSAV